MTNNVKIGDTLYRFDGNRRVYRDRSFSGGGAPIYREHFEPLKVMGETNVSWILERGWKANKKNLTSAKSLQFGGRGFFTKEGMEEDIWANDHRYKIIQTLKRAPLGVLRQVADLVGYKPEQ